MLPQNQVLLDWDKMFQEVPFDFFKWVSRIPNHPGLVKIGCYAKCVLDAMQR